MSCTSLSIIFAPLCRSFNEKKNNTPQNARTNVKRKRKLPKLPQLSKPRWMMKEKKVPSIYSEVVEKGTSIRTDSSYYMRVQEDGCNISMQSSMESDPWVDWHLEQDDDRHPKDAKNYGFELRE
mmetsp:Transcript_24775/g.37657  ORF Transcript_24775/g.37657 Transcript_24775/m.37657 type:complete len:124 (-) Transcript_24775:108-479(-)